MCELSTVPPALATTCCARAALWRTSSERRPRSAVLTTLRPKSPREAESSVMPAAPSEDCARSGPDPAGESAPAVSCPTDTAPSSDGADFISLYPHDARARTRSTSALAPRDFATIAECNSSMPSTSLGRVPPAEHPLAPKYRLQPNLLPVHCPLPTGSLMANISAFTSARPDSQLTGRRSCRAEMLTSAGWGRIAH